jgi:peptide/nickel transport system permease protein
MSDLVTIQPKRTSRLGVFWEQSIDFLKRLFASPSAVIGGIIVLITIGLGIGVPLFDEYDAVADNNLRARYAEPDCVVSVIRSRFWGEEGADPITFDNMTCDYPFGADKSGRGIFRRVGHGRSVSLRVAVFAVAIAASIGIPIGLIAGYISGWVDSVFMRFMDVVLAFPSLLLAIAIVTVRGASLENGMIAIAVTQVPIYARLARSMAVGIRNSEYVLATRSIGAGSGRIIAQHVFPNSLAPLIVQATLGLGTAVIETAALGFLGLGQQPPFPELGKMLADSQASLASGKWWVMVFPGAAIIFMVLGFNLLGDGLRDVLDPRLKK